MNKGVFLMDNSSLAYSEVCTILNMLEDEYKERVPKNVMDFFEEERDKEYNPIIDVNIPLEKQNLKRKTLVLLAILNLNYWCENEEEKQSFLDELDKNEEEKKELEEKYNPDNLFKKKQDESTENNLQIIEYKKPNFIQILLTKIKKIFKREN